MARLIWFLVLALTLGIASFAHAQLAPTRPNILLILADDLGHAIIDQPENPPVPTPSLDRLRASGVWFSTAYATAPVCGPSRAGILTGQYQQRLGFEFNPDPRTHEARPGAAIGLRPGVPLLPDVLAGAGYDTALIGKWHLGQRPRQHPTRRGFGEFFGFLGGTCDYLPGNPGRALYRGIERIEEPEYLTDAFAREAIAFIERPRTDPFFLFLAFNAIHEPARSPPGDGRFPEIEDATARDYARMIASLDDAVGRVLGSLDRAGLAENTIVLFMSDNGGNIDAGVSTNGALRMGKQYLFEGGLRVPLLVRWPGVTTPGATTALPVGGLDIAPTLLAAAGVAPPDAVQLDGRDLRPLIEHATAPPVGSTSAEPGRSLTNNPVVAFFGRRPLFWRSGPTDAVRVGDWKLIRSGPSLWLFDLAADPGETTNLAETHADHVARLRTLLDAWAATLPEPDWAAGEIDRVMILGLEYLRAL